MAAVHECYVAWWEDWLLLGTDEGVFKAIKVPSRVFATLQTEEGKTCFAPVDHDDSLHPESHQAHVVRLLLKLRGASSVESSHRRKTVFKSLIASCAFAFRVKGLVAVGDTEGGWSIWKEANGKWLQNASSRGCSSPVIGLQWVFPLAHSPHVSLCSLHEDGRLQSGTAEGLRLWSRTLRKRCMRFCAAVNGGSFVVATEDGELLVYDSRGVYGRKLPLKAEISQCEAVTDLDWQPGSWGIRPLLVAFSTGHAFLLRIDRAVPALPIDSRLISCVAAKWNPSGSLAALLGVPALRSRAPVVLKGEPAACPCQPQKSTGVHQPGVSLRIVQTSGEIAASVNFSSEDPQTLAWASSGQQIAVVTNKKLSVILVRQKEVFACSDNGNFVVGTLIPEPLLTQVCFWKNKSCTSSIRAFRGPRLLACCDDLCAVVPYATAALPPSFPWDSENESFEQRQQSHQHHQGPYLLPEEDGPKISVCESNHPVRQSRGHFHVELCDAAGNTLDILSSPLEPRHAVLLPHCLVISDGSHQLWICWFKADTQVGTTVLASVIDLTTLSDVPPGSGEVTAVGGRGCCLVVASSVTQPTQCTSQPAPSLHMTWKIYGLAQGPHALQGETLTGAFMFSRQPRLSPEKASIQEVWLVQWFRPSLAKALCEPVEHALDYQWASDHGDLIAVLQLSRVLLVHIRIQSGSESSCMVPDEPREALSEHLHLIDFTSLCVRALCTKSLLNVSAKSAASQPPRIITYKAEPLLQMGELLNLRRRSMEGRAGEQRILYRSAGLDGPCTLQQATELAARLSHTTLWKLLADTALAIEQLDVTEEAFVRCEDYIGLQVLKRVRALKTGGEGVAAMAALAGDILKAGAFYEAQNKHIAAASLFLSFGYWNEAANTLNAASTSQRLGDSASLSKVCKSLAEAYGEMGEWQLAINFYKRLPPQEGFLDALFYSENYEELECVGRKLAEGEETPLLLHAAQLVAAAGRGQIAAACFLKADRPNAAIDAAWRGGEWQEAICLAREHCGAVKVHELANAYRRALQHRQDVPSEVHVVEAFMKLGIPEAATQELNLLTDHLDPAIRNPFQQRKAHIIAALLARENRLLDAISAEEALTSASCSDRTQRDSFLQPGQSGRGGECAISLNQKEEKCWRSASACHLYLLCCYYLSQRKARFALCAAVRLRDCYSMESRLHIRGRLLCISACMAKEWELCLQALHELETSPEASASERKKLGAIGVTLRANCQLAKPSKTHAQLECSKCSALSGFWECFCPSCDVAFPWCAATGLPIRYVLLMRGQSKTTEAVKETIKAFCGDGLEYTAKNEGRAALDCEETWPYGGPECPLTCGVCGLSTAAWGPEGPIEDCPLCTQPFSRTTKSLAASQETQLPWREDRVARYLSMLHPEEILSQIEKLNELVR
ncbi:hypothetical protein Emag_006039 [Eimeria magna]